MSEFHFLSLLCIYKGSVHGSLLPTAASCVLLEGNSAATGDNVGGEAGGMWGKGQAWES